jgi:Raf kinase inhibitor-like YbhB/YbcL family protein
LAAAVLALAIGGCGGASHSATTSTAPAATIVVTSPAFAAGGRIPRAYTCDGADTPVPLHWSGVPAGARDLTVVMRDPDAPGGTFTHWSVSHIAASVTHIGGGATLPADAVAGRNSFGSAGYRGPCPPPGDRPHHYVVTVKALGRSGVVVGAGTLVGMYGR